ncbi:unnamed protein product [Sphagnum troendelagicum]|uniref:Uncharacterized protein n=1 Tax=Sphagnum troendelagicum TaxID=128251 RepID=A0ABP0U3N0_9BRYO
MTLALPSPVRLPEFFAAFPLVDAWHTRPSGCPNSSLHSYWSRTPGSPGPVKLPEFFAAFLLVDACRAGTSQPVQAANLNRRAEKERIVAVVLVRVRSKEDDKICFRFAILEHRSVAAAATDVIKIQPLFYVFSHVYRYRLLVSFLRRGFGKIIASSVQFRGCLDYGLSFSKSVG